MKDIEKPLMDYEFAYILKQDKIKKQYEYEKALQAFKEANKRFLKASKVLNKINERISDELDKH